MRPETEPWLRQAEADLLASRNSYSNSHYEWASFQAQQAAEKALKAFLYEREFDQERLRRIRHSLFGPGSALEACVELESSFLDLRNEADLLNQHSISSRYPDAITDTINQAPADYYQSDIAIACVGAAQAVLEFVRERLAS